MSHEDFGDKKQVAETRPDFERRGHRAGNMIVDRTANRQTVTAARTVTHHSRHTQSTCFVTRSGLVDEWHLVFFNLLILNDI